MEFKRDDAVAFTGHQDYDDRAEVALRSTVRGLWGKGYRFFLCGMAAGFDLAAAEAVLSLRGECPGVELVAVVPFSGQEKRFCDRDKARYVAVMNQADRVVILAETYSRGCYYRRNDYLVDHAGKVVSWYGRRNSGTGYTVRRAVRQGLEVINLYELAVCPTLFEVI